jgi:hypothetical protein
MNTYHIKRHKRGEEWNNTVYYRYSGVVRSEDGKDAWVCPHSHLTPRDAKRCAASYDRDARMAADA